MALALVGSIATANNSNDMIDFTKTGTTLGNGLILGLYWAGGTAEPTLTVTGETVLEAGTAATNASMSAKGWCAIFYIKSLVSGGDKKFNSGSWSNSAWAGFIAEISGQDTTTFLDDNSGASGNSATLSTSVTTTAANDLIMAMAGSVNSDPAHDTGYTEITVANAFDFDQGQYNLDVGAIGAKTVQMTTSSGQWVFKAAAFKAVVDTSVLVNKTLVAEGHTFFISG